MTIDDEIKDEKLQYELNREAAKKWASASGKLININILQAKKYYHLFKVEQHLFNSPFGKAFEE